MIKPPKIVVLNGPNLNMLGTREPDIYGRQTLADIEARCHELAAEKKFDLDCFQSNFEGEIVEKIQSISESTDWIVINAAGLTHTSVALRDSLSIFPGNIIEVHISNIYAREEFRHKSLISDIAKGVIAGFGLESYLMALNAIMSLHMET